jgi:hypothetical protein
MPSPGIGNDQAPVSIRLVNAARGLDNHRCTLAGLLKSCLFGHVGPQSGLHLASA